MIVYWQLWRAKLDVRINNAKLVSKKLRVRPYDTRRTFYAALFRQRELLVYRLADVILKKKHLLYVLGKQFVNTAEDGQTLAV